MRVVLLKIKKSFRYLIFFCFLLSIKNSSSQKGATIDLIRKVKEASYYDSTRVFTIGEKAIQEAKKKNDKSSIAKINLYYGNYFFYVRNLEKAKVYFVLSRKIAKESDDEQTERLANIRLAFLDFEKGQRDKAVEELNSYFKQALNQNDYNNAVEALNLLGCIEEAEGNTKLALTTYYEGLVLSEKFNLKYYPAVFKNNLGIIKMNNGNDSAAYTDFSQALVIAERDQDMRLANDINMNMCIIDVRRNKANEASELFKRVLKYYKDNNLPLELSGNYINLAMVFLNNKDKNSALIYYDSAIAILEKLNLPKELNAAYLGRSNVWIQLNEIEKSLNQLNTVRSYFEKNSADPNSPYFYYQLYEIFSKKADFKKALEYYKKYQQLRLESEEKLNAKILTELQQNYKVQQKEIELEKEKTKTLELKKKNQEEKFFNLIIIAIAIAIIIISSSLSYVAYSRKLKKEQQLFSQQLIKNIEEERKRIARDLHDDIGQSLSMVKSKIVNERNKSTQLPDSIEKELGNVIEQTRDISRNLYPSNLEKIGLVRSIAALMENIQNSTNFECSFDIAEKSEILPIHVKTHLFRIIQESVNNTIKHSEASALKISIQEYQRNYTMIYQDNGKGMTIRKGQLGIGLLTIQERANIIGAQLEFDDKQEKGFKFNLKFSLNS